MKLHMVLYWIYKSGLSGIHWHLYMPPMNQSSLSLNVPISQAWGGESWWFSNSDFQPGPGLVLTGEDGIRKGLHSQEKCPPYCVWRTPWPATWPWISLFPCLGLGVFTCPMEETTSNVTSSSNSWLCEYHLQAKKPTFPRYSRILRKWPCAISWLPHINTVFPGKQKAVFKRAWLCKFWIS